MTQASYILHFIYLHHITPTNDKKYIVERQNKQWYKIFAEYIWHFKKKIHVIFQLI